MRQIRQDAAKDSVQVIESLNEILPAAFAARGNVDKALQLPLEKDQCKLFSCSIVTIQITLDILFQIFNETMLMYDIMFNNTR
jgi:hypothetical protein